jgi:hypothetical protein
MSVSVKSQSVRYRQCSKINHQTKTSEHPFTLLLTGLLILKHIYWQCTRPHSQNTQYNEKRDYIQEDDCVTKRRIRDCKVYQLCIWGPCSSGMLRGISWLLSDVSKQPVGPTFKGQTFQDNCLTREDGTDRLPPNVCNQPSTYTRLSYQKSEGQKSRIIVGGI